jgi:hypothetical protein
MHNETAVAAAHIFNRSMALFADADDDISVGPQLHSTGTLTLTLNVADLGAFRLTIFGSDETEAATTTAVKLFEVDGNLTSSRPPRVTAFRRGAWEAEVLALNVHAAG